jgi:hypothetical protein
MDHPFQFDGMAAPIGSEPGGAAIYAEIQEAAACPVRPRISSAGQSAVLEKNVLNQIVKPMPDQHEFMPDRHALF